MKPGFRLRLLAILLACYFLSAVAAQDRLFGQAAADLQAEVAAAAKDGKTLALLFEMKDCAPCAALKKEVFPQPAAIRGFGQNYRTVTVALDGQKPLRDPQGQPVSTEALAGRYRVQGTPAIAFLDPQGKLLYRHQGPIADAAALVELGHFVRDAAYENEPLAEYRRRQTTPSPRAEPYVAAAPEAIVPAGAPALHEHDRHASAQQAAHLAPHP